MHSVIGRTQSSVHEFEFFDSGERQRLVMDIIQDVEWGNSEHLGRQDALLLRAGTVCVGPGMHSAGAKKTAGALAMNRTKCATVRLGEHKFGLYNKKTGAYHLHLDLTDAESRGEGKLKTYQFAKKWVSFGVDRPGARCCAPGIIPRVSLRTGSLSRFS